MYCHTFCDVKGKKHRVLLRFNAITSQNACTVTLFGYRNSPGYPGYPVDPGKVVAASAPPKLPSTHGRCQHAIDASLEKLHRIDSRTTAENSVGFHRELRK